MVYSLYCSCFQAMNVSSGGIVEQGKVREDGQFKIKVDKDSDLFR